MAMDDTIADFERCCQSASSAQERVLSRILEENASSRYLQKYGSPQTLAAFKSQVPIISYEDIAADIETMVAGDKEPLLCVYPVVAFFASSGTTSGKTKIIPVTAENLTAVGNASEVSNSFRTRSFPSENGRIVGFLYCSEDYKTKCGLVVSNVSTYTWKSERFRTELSSKLTTPYEVLVAGSDWRELTYCHFLCALLQRDHVEQIISVFSYTICEALRMFKSEWREICSDIRDGSLSETKVTDPKLRQAVLSCPLFADRGGNPAVAEAVSKICSKESWSGILSLLFPRARFVIAVVTGSMKLYVPILRGYAGDGLPIVGIDYSSSEGPIGINADPHCDPEQVAFTVVPTALYYEFLPVDSNCPSIDILDLHEVRVGQKYEVVITNFAGLYRYKVGDVIEIEGFFHEVPRLVFCYRTKAVLSLHNEMVDEQELQSVVSRVFQDAGLEVANFTSFGSTSVLPPHYTIACELTKNDNSSLLETCCSNIDRSLNRKYIQNRLDGTIDSLELMIVERGTFEKTMLQAVEHGANPGQYKTPRCVSSPRMLEVLEAGRIASYKSEEMPRSALETWEPSFPKER